jgi:hypothetical protein
MADPRPKNGLPGNQHSEADERFAAGDLLDRFSIVPLTGIARDRAISQLLSAYHGSGPQRSPLTVSTAKDAAGFIAAAQVSAVLPPSVANKSAADQQLFIVSGSGIVPISKAGADLALAFRDVFHGDSRFVPLAVASAAADSRASRATGLEVQPVSLNTYSLGGDDYAGPSAFSNLFSPHSTFTYAPSTLSAELRTDNRGVVRDYTAVTVRPDAPSSPSMTVHVPTTLLPHNGHVDYTGRQQDMDRDHSGVNQHGPIIIQVPPGSGGATAQEILDVQAEMEALMGLPSSAAATLAGENPLRPRLSAEEQFFAGLAQQPPPATLAGEPPPPPTLDELARGSITTVRPSVLTLGGEIPRPPPTVAAVIARQQQEAQAAIERQQGADRASANRATFLSAVHATAGSGSPAIIQGDRVVIGEGANSVSLSLAQVSAITGPGGLQGFVRSVMSQAPAPTAMTSGLNGINFNMAEYVANALTHAGVQVDRATLTAAVNARMSQLQGLPRTLGSRDPPGLTAPELAQHALETITRLGSALPVALSRAQPAPPVVPTSSAAPPGAPPSSAAPDAEGANAETATPSSADASASSQRDRVGRLARVLRRMDGAASGAEQAPAPQGEGAVPPVVSPVPSAPPSSFTVNTALQPVPLVPPTAPPPPASSDTPAAGAGAPPPSPPSAAPTAAPPPPQQAVGVPPPQPRPAGASLQA